MVPAAVCIENCRAGGHKTHTHTHVFIEIVLLFSQPPRLFQYQSREFNFGVSKVSSTDDVRALVEHRVRRAVVGPNLRACIGTDRRRHGKQARETEAKAEPPKSDLTRLQQIVSIYVDCVGDLVVAKYDRLGRWICGHFAHILY